MNGWKVVQKFTDTMTTCEKCGKMELSGTVHFVHEDGSELYAGTSCAAKMMGTTVAQVRGMIESTEKKASILEDAFRSDFARKFNTTPREFIRTHGAAGVRGVDAVRKQFLKHEAPYFAARWVGLIRADAPGRTYAACVAENIARA